MKASCIIPTYGRPSSVVLRTLESLFKLKEEFFEHVMEVWIIDQNRHPLDIEENLSKLNVDMRRIQIVSYCAHCQKNLEINKIKQEGKVPIVHVFGLHPSVTIAKNYAIKRSSGEILLFFDDDIIAKPNVIHHHMRLQKTTPNIGFVGGREITYPPDRGRSRLKMFLADLANQYFAETEEEKKFKLHGRYIGRVNKKSFFLCDYSIDHDHLVQVNTVRGCNASLRRKVFDRAGGFDESFQGTALREESDLSLRVEKIGFQNYFFGKAMVIHMRQFGGCNNLAQSYQVIASKLENELRFQRKHFPHVNPLYFLIRLIPLTIESFRATWGTNLFLLLQTTLSFAFNRSKHAKP